MLSYSENNRNWQTQQERAEEDFAPMTNRRKCCNELPIQGILEIAKEVDLLHLVVINEHKIYRDIDDQYYYAA